MLFLFHSKYIYFSNTTRHGRCDNSLDTAISMHTVLYNVLSGFMVEKK